MLGIVLWISGYAALVKVGVLRSPFAPTISGDLVLARSARPGLRVLFVGNSLTYKNGLPALVHQLAATDAGANPIFSIQWTAGGSTLRRASRDRSLSALINEIPWDVVVLQEQSRLLSLPSLDERRRKSYPYARALHEKIAARGARTMLFMTWGYEDGDDRTVDGDTYEWMQARLEQGYGELAADLGASVAPVGLAWADSRRRAPHYSLWAWDGVHPNRAGSYLAACVFYKLLTGRNPPPEFTAGLRRDEVLFLQYVAVEAVAQ